MKHNIVSDGNSGSVTVFVDGQLLVADDKHPNYRAIVEKVLNQDSENLVDLFDATRAVAERFERLSDRVTVRGGHVFFDGDEVHDTLTQQIVRFMEAGLDDWKPLVNFWEKVSQNPNEHSREHLYRWLTATDGFTITEDGDLVGYKGLTRERTSVQSGTATVDGKTVNGRVPNVKGTVIEMPRSAVNHDPANGCSTGLHVGTWDYASTFGQATVKVLVNPRDVVSVPTDCNGQKMRVCRYTVAEDARVRDDSPLSYVHAEEDFYEDECPECFYDLDSSGYCDNCGEYDDRSY